MTYNNIKSGIGEATGAFTPFTRSQLRFVPGTYGDKKKKGHTESPKTKLTNFIRKVAPPLRLGTFRDPFLGCKGLQFLDRPSLQAGSKRSMGI